jgi:hypothetical protein
MSETNDLHVLKIGKLVFLIFMMYSIFLQSTVHVYLIFVPLKPIRIIGGSDSWSSDNRSSTVLPSKSRHKYEKTYNIFNFWRTSKNVRDIDEEVKLAFFHEKVSFPVVDILTPC